MRPRTDDRAELTAFLGAFCFFLSAVEYMIPKPLPFMRLGIANLPILLAIDLLPFPSLILLALVKVVGMSLVSGSLFSYVALFSLVGTLAATLAMWGARRLGGRFISAVGVSVVGAMVSNAVQILLAEIVVFGAAARLIAPPFLGMGLITGTLLGLFSERFARDSRWYALARGSAPSQEASAISDPPIGKEEALASSRVDGSASARVGRRLRAGEGRSRRREAWESLFPPAALAGTGALLSIAFLLQPLLWIKAIFFGFFLIAALASGKKVSLLATLLVSSGIVFVNLIVPVGRVLGRLGPLVITETALREGLEKAITFEGLLYASKATIRSGLRMPGRFGTLVGRAFLYYDRIIEYRGRVRPASFVRDADELMLRMWEMQVPTASASEFSRGGRPLGRAVLLVVLAMCAIATVMGFLSR